jgi:chromosome segregation ATPase
MKSFFFFQRKDLNISGKKQKRGMVPMNSDESQESEGFLHTKTRTELESDLEQCLQRKKTLEETQTKLHNVKIDLETILDQKEKTISELQSQITALQSEKETAETQLKSLEETRSHDQGALEEFKEQIQHLEDEKSQLETENSKLRTMVEQLDRDKETYKAYSDEAERILEVKTKKLLADLRYIEEENQRHIEEISKQDQLLRDYEQKIRDLTEKQDTFLQKMTDTQNIHTVSKEFMEHMESKLVDLQNLMDSFSSRLQEPEIPTKDVEEHEEVPEEEPSIELPEEHEEVPEEEPSIELPEEHEEVPESILKEEGEEEGGIPYATGEDEEDIISDKLSALSDSFEESEDIFESDLELELSEPEDLSSLEIKEEKEDIEEKSGEELGKDTEHPDQEYESESVKKESEKSTSNGTEEEKEEKKFPWEEENEPGWGF